MRTAPEFELVDLGEYPALIPGGAVAVRGELYVVDVKTLARLDKFEQHPKLFVRTEISLEDGRRAQAYLGRPENIRGAPRIESGDWRQHQRSVN